MSTIIDDYPVSAAQTYLQIPCKYFVILDSTYPVDVEFVRNRSTYGNANGISQGFALGPVSEELEGVKIKSTGGEAQTVKLSFTDDQAVYRKLVGNVNATIVGTPNVNIATMPDVTIAPGESVAVTNFPASFGVNNFPAGFDATLLNGLPAVDRNVNDITQGNYLALPPAGWTQRAIYTVPAGRLARISLARFFGKRSASPTTSSTVTMRAYVRPNLTADNNYIYYDWAALPLVDDGFGTVLDADITLTAGDSIIFETADASTGGLITFNWTIAGYEFDA